MATSSITEDHVRFCRLCILVFGKGRDILAGALKQNFSRIYGSSKTLQDIFSDANVQKILFSLSQKVFLVSQKDLLYPQHHAPGGSLPLGAPSQAVSYNDLDITFITMLLRNLGRMKATATVWKMPAPTDTSLPASITRIRLARNTLSHTASGSFSEIDYQTMWKRVVDDLVNVSQLYSKKELDDLQQQPLGNDSQRVHDILDTIETCCKTKTADLRALDLKLADIARDMYSKLDIMDDKISCLNVGQQEILKILKQNTQSISDGNQQKTKLDQELILAKDESLSSQKDRNPIQKILGSAKDRLYEKKEQFPSNPGNKRHSAENLPDRNPAFTGRENVLKVIHSTLNKDVSTICQCITVTGLGGIGKSQVALEYAHIHRTSYNFIRWIDCDNTSLHISLYRFAKDLNIPTSDQRLDEITRCIYKRLEKSPKFLLVFDNVEDYKSIKPFLIPTSSLHVKQHILITSQNQQWKNPTVPIDIFNDIEAIKFMKKYFEDSNFKMCQDNEFLLLAQALGNLPIALNHACAYIKQTPGLSIKSYLNILEENCRVVLDEDLGGAEQNVLKTLLTTVNKLIKTDPNAVRILCQCAVIAPDKIPTALFMKSDKYATLNSLRCLKNYSLVTSFVQEDVFYIHQLLKKILLYIVQQSNTEHRSILCKPDGSNFLKLKEDIFQPLINNFMAWNPVSLEEIPTSADFSSTLLIYEHMAALFENLNIPCEELINSLICGFKHLTKAAEIIENIFNTIDTLTEENFVRYFCDWLYQLKNLEGQADAKKLWEKVLADSEVKNETDCDNYIYAMLFLGSLLLIESKCANGFEYFEKARSITETVHGKNSMELNDLLNLIGFVLCVMGYLDNAISYFKECLKISEQIFEVKHPKCTTLLECIGYILLWQNKYDESLQHFQRALTVRKTVLHRDHPENADCKKKIEFLLQKQAEALHVQGKYNEAIKMQQKVLMIKDRVYGKEHPEYADTLFAVGKTLKAQGNCEDALQLYKTALRIYEPCDVYYVDVLFNIGIVLRKMKGREGQAYRYLKQALSLGIASCVSHSYACPFIFGVFLKNMGLCKAIMHKHNKSCVLFQIADFFQKYRPGR